MPSLFTKIINGEIPCHKIYEDDQCLAFLDIRPIKEGHTLVIPKKEIDYIFDLEDPDLANLMLCAKKIASAIKQTIECDRIGIMVAGLEVPHTHVHLIPIKSVSDLNFSLAENADNENLAQTAQKIRNNFS
ncbi:MAG: HIT family protein [Candidatus Omnitrophica bacterium]|nr:HIT family protein [Candidatus Omnitrophota bacterium]